LVNERVVVFTDTAKHYSYLKKQGFTVICILESGEIGARCDQVLTVEAYPGLSFKTVSDAYRAVLVQGLEIPVSGNHLTVLVNASSIFDLAASLYLVSILQERVGITLIVFTPNSSAGDHVKASFYAWLKTIALLDVSVNSSGGWLTYVLVDGDSPIQLISYLLQTALSADRVAEKHFRSLVHVKLKRFIIPFREVYALAELLHVSGICRRVIDELRETLALMHITLDEASTDLWSYARSFKPVVEKYWHVLGEFLSKYGVLVEEVGKAVERVAAAGKFTEYLVTPFELLDTLLRGIPVTGIYSKLSVGGRVRKVLESGFEKLVDTYTRGSLQAVGDTREYVVCTRDMASYVESPENAVVISGLGEVGLVRVSAVPVNYELGVNTEYIPRDFREAYFKVAGLALTRLYPPEISIGGRRFTPQVLHSANFVNYHGLKYRQANR